MRPERQRERRSLSCRKASRLLTQRGARGDDWLEAHLERCAECRELDRFVDRIRAELTVSAGIDPPPRVERHTRALLLEGAVAVPALLRPAMAAGLATAGLFAGVTGLAAILARQTGELGPVLAIGATAVYLGLSVVATLPLLLRTPSRARAARLEARS